MVENLSNTVSATAAMRYKNSGSTYAFTGLGSPTRAVYGGLGPNILAMYTGSTAGMTLMVDQAGPITFYSGSPIAERARIASNGSLVLNPNQTSGSIPILDIYGGGSGALGAIRIGDNSYSAGHTNYWDIGRDNTTSGAFTFALNASEKMRITTGGQLLVGDTSGNGVISARYNFSSVPLQNYKDVIVCGNSGFSGSLSDLRYYSYALNIFIEQIIFISITPMCITNAKICFK
jgi:hypothetical protein